MPGSPPKSVREPGTSPPPKTRFSSLFFVSSRVSVWKEISEIRWGFATLFTELSAVFQLPFSGFWITSSTMVFHCLQELHCPCHLAYCETQFWQKKLVFVLAMSNCTL